MRKTQILITLMLTTSVLMAQEPWIAPDEANALKGPFSLENDKMIAKGEKLFGKICWTCHGEMGEGNGVAADQLLVKPKDLTGTEVQKQSDGAIYWKITTGRDAMTSYQEMFTDEQRWQLVAFIRSIAKE